jgi:glycosyltransferase involved in cell wall biosynthesis
VIGQLTYGGAERQLYELVRGLDRQRFQPVVYCLSSHTTPYGELLTSLGVPLTVVPRQRHFEWGRIRALASLMRRDRVDIVHAFLFQANPYAWLAARLARTPHLVTSARNCQTLGRVRDWANRVAFRASDAIICNGGAVRDFIVERYAAPANTCVVIHNGVDLARFAPARDPRRGGRPRQVLGIGRLVPQKDFALFIEAAALLRRTQVDVRFAIVGDGPQRAALERHVGEAGLAGVISFLGERQDIPDLMRDADVLWLSSQWEGLPNVVLEAAASGTPVVARDTGATREIVSHGVTGYLVSERDPAAFAAHTEALLTDPALLRKMGEAARHVAEEHFSLSRMVTSTEDLYRTVSAGRGWPVTERPSRGSVGDDPTAVMRDRILASRVPRGPRSATRRPFSS